MSVRKEMGLLELLVGVASLAMGLNAFIMFIRDNYQASIAAILIAWYLMYIVD